MQDNLLFNAEQSLKMHLKQSDSKPFSNARPFFYTNTALLLFKNRIIPPFYVGI